MARLLVGLALGLSIGLVGTVRASTESSGSGEPVAPVIDPRVACIVRVESRGDPGATNPRTGAAGLGQFLYGTWLTTPQGQAGFSRYDPDANLAAISWMLAVGRAREFDAVRYAGC